MQCPPTNPGLKGRKFHLVPVASNTSSVSIYSLLKRTESSFTKAILISLCEFSIILAASATLMEEVRCVPAATTLL